MSDPVMKPQARLIRIAELIKMLQSLFGGIDLKQLIEILQSLGGLLPLPDLDNEAACRAWARKVVDNADVIADLTGTQVDDAMVSIADIVVENDTYWAWAWKIVQMVRSKSTTTPLEAATAAEELCKAMNPEGDPKFNPAIIILIQVAVKLIELWTSKK